MRRLWAVWFLLSKNHAACLQTEPSIGNASSSGRAVCNANRTTSIRQAGVSGRSVIRQGGFGAQNPAACLRIGRWIEDAPSSGRAVLRGAKPRSPPPPQAAGCNFAPACRSRFVFAHRRRQTAFGSDEPRHTGSLPVCLWRTSVRRSSAAPRRAAMRSILSDSARTTDLYDQIQPLTTN